MPASLPSRARWPDDAPGAVLLIGAALHAAGPRLPGADEPVLGPLPCTPLCDGLAGAVRFQAIQEHAA